MTEKESSIRPEREHSSDPAGDEWHSLTMLFEDEYENLKQLARSYLRKRKPLVTLSTTALVNETWIRFTKSDRKRFASKLKFYGLASMAMRSVLEDEARTKLASKRNRGKAHQALEDDHVGQESDIISFLTIQDVLTSFSSEYPDHAKVYELRHFAGLKLGEIAELLEVSISTTKRYLVFSESWMQRWRDR